MAAALNDDKVLAGHRVALLRHAAPLPRACTAQHKEVGLGRIGGENNLGKPENTARRGCMERRAAAMAAAAVMMAVMAGMAAAAPPNMIFVLAVRIRSAIN